MVGETLKQKTGGADKGQSQRILLATVRYWPLPGGQYEL